MFRLEEYKTAQENVDKLDYEVRRKIVEFETEAKRLESDRQTLKDRDAERVEKEEKRDRLKKIENELQGELDKAVKTTEKLLKETRSDLSSTRQKITDLAKEIEELNKVIKQMEDSKKAAQRLKDFHVWLTDYFVKTLTLIE